MILYKMNDSMIFKYNNDHPHKKTLLSCPTLNIQGCFGWNFIPFTPSTFVATCPFNTFNGKITGSLIISV